MLVLLKYYMPKHEYTYENRCIENGIKLIEIKGIEECEVVMQLIQQKLKHEFPELQWSVTLETQKAIHSILTLVEQIRIIKTIKICFRDPRDLCIPAKQEWNIPA